jgi:hypothetical protein
LQDYNFKITHLPGKSNTITNLLSQRKDFEEGVNPNKQVTLLPEHLFACKTYLENNLDVTGSWDKASLYTLWTGVSSETSLFCDMVVALAVIACVFQVVCFMDIF